MHNDLCDGIKEGGNLGEENEGLDVICDQVGCIFHPGKQAFYLLDGWFWVPRVGEQHLKNCLEVSKDGGKSGFCVVDLNGLDEVGIDSVDLILLEEGLQESLKDEAGELAIAFLPLDVARDYVVIRGGNGLGRLRDVGDPHAAGGGEVRLHLGPPGKVVHPLEERDLGQGDNLRVGGGGSGIPGRRHFDKVSMGCSTLVHKNIVFHYRSGSHKGAQWLRSPPYNVGAWVLHSILPMHA